VLLEYARGHCLGPRILGPFPATEALEFLAANAVSNPLQGAFRSQLEGMLGDFDEARASVAGARLRARELGERLLAAGMSMQATEAELLAGDPEAALALATEGIAELRELGERGWLSTVTCLAAEAAYRLGRDDDAWRLAQEAQEIGAADDVITQMLILQVRAKLLSRRGDHEEAERLAREAVAWAAPTDSVASKADTYRDLAVVLAAAGKRDEALSALDEAQALYAEKGHTAGLARVEELRSELGASLEA
jgi:tetratricopeptide (TPR) repeat protein